MRESIHKDMVLTNMALEKIKHLFVIQRFRHEENKADVIIFLGKMLIMLDKTYSEPQGYFREVREWIESVCSRIEITVRPE